ncbi:MAG: sigma-54-dependent Fis family transcriptional regulator, partial [Pseudomonadota bacterium]|nr:sigma-54-dependent Fis family transcriptional regulator [Pseudomonadota bacterium]
EHDWPGNVRELQNVLRRAIVLHDAETLDAGMLGSATGDDDIAASAAPELEIDVSGLRRLHSAMVSQQPYAGRKLRQIERDTIQGTIAACGGSIPQAARALGVSPSTIYRKRESWS